MLIGLIFLSFQPLFWLASPDNVGVIFSWICFIIGCIFMTLGVVL